MKSLFNFIVLVCLFAVTSCSSSKEHDDDLYIILSNTSQSLEQDGGTVTLNVSSNTSWTINDVPDWVSIDKKEGTGTLDVIITVSENTLENDRSSELIFSHNDIKAKFLISQKERKYEFVWRPLCFSNLELTDVSTDSYNRETYSFITRSLFINPEANPAINNELFCGNVINSNLTNNVTIESYYKNFSYNPIILFASPYNIKFEQIDKPSLEAQKKYAQKMPDPKARLRISNDRGIVFNTYKELNLLGMSNMGVAFEEYISGSSYQNKEMTMKNGIVFSYDKPAFTIGMDYDLYIKEQIDQDKHLNLASITSVSYGHVGVLIVESDQPVSEIRRLTIKIREGNSFEDSELDVLKELKAYYFSFDESQKLFCKKGDYSVIQFYYSQMNTDDSNIYPYKIEMLDYPDAELNMFKFKMTMK